MISFDIIDLQLLADGGGDGASTGSDGQTMGVTSGDADQNGSNGLVSTDNNQQGSDDEYNQLINTKFKEAHQREIKSIVDKRTAKAREIEANNSIMEMSHNLLASKYGVDPSDYKALANAIEHDVSLVDKETMETGNDPEQTLELKRLKLESRMREKREKEAAEQQKKEATINNLMQQEAAFKAKGHSNFNLLNEMQTNEQFKRLVQNGISVEAAYNSIYAEQEKAAAVQKAIDDTRNATARSIQAGRSRPAENGLGGQAASEMSIDIKSMDSKSFLEMTNKIMKGQYNR